MSDDKTSVDAVVAIFGGTEFDKHLNMVLEVEAEDILLDRIAAGDETVVKEFSQDLVVQLLAAWRNDVHSKEIPEFVEHDVRPMTKVIDFLVVIMMFVLAFGCAAVCCFFSVALSSYRDIYTQPPTKKQDGN